ncbi:MAG TPA: DUF922 domain-containing protein [Gemmatimonadaceae bacterium]|nr:DUF922 domain-containing protein [Gemmatimonadaceae bacterium]
MNRALHRSVLAIALSIVAPVGCASGPRNPVLDTYPAGVSGHTTVVYYDIHGKTYPELLADLRRLGPNVDGRSFVGETRSPMRWSWRVESSAAPNCSIEFVNVSVNSQITLPRWTPPADADTALVTEWNRFLKALELHEAGHKDISARAARDIIRGVRQVSGLCSTINIRANDLAREIVDRSVVEQREYDFTTRHGLTQGTAFGSGRRQSSTVSSMRNSSILAFATRYAGAWSGQDPVKFGAFYDESGSLIVNGSASVGRPAIIATARSYMAAFPDMIVKPDSLRQENDETIFYWTWTGTNTGPGGTGNPVKLSGYERWTIGSNGLITKSDGHFDNDEYQRQLKGSLR